MRVTYVKGSDLADLAITWQNSAGEVIDFSTGYTFAAKVGSPGTAATFDKSTGFTGAAVAPNLTIQWAVAGELNTLPGGAHTLQVTATRTSDSRQRIMQMTLNILDAIT